MQCPHFIVNPLNLLKTVRRLTKIALFKDCLRTYLMGNAQAYINQLQDIIYINTVKPESVPKSNDQRVLRQVLFEVAQKLKIFSRNVSLSLSKTLACNKHHIRHLEQQILLFEKNAKQFMQSVQKYYSSEKVYLEHVGQFQNYRKSREDKEKSALNAYDFNQIVQFRQECTRLSKSLNKQEINLTVYNSQMKRIKAQISKSINSLKILFLEESKKEFQRIFDILLILHREYQHFQNTFFSLAHTLARQGHQAQPQSVTTHQQKQSIMEVLIKISSSLEKLRRKLLQHKNIAFGAKKIQYFLNKFKKYFGQNLFDVFQRTNVLQHIVFTAIQLIHNNFVIKENDLVKLVADSCQISKQLGLTKNQDKARLDNLLIKKDFNDRSFLNKISQMLKKMLKQLDKLFTRKYDSLPNFDPASAVLTVIQSTPKFYDIFSHRFLQQSFPSFLVRSQSRDKFFKELNINSVFSLAQQQRSNVNSCVCSGPQYTILKSYKCALRCSIILAGKLQVTKKAIFFRSPFNERNLIFGQTLLVIPLTQINRIFKNDTNSVFQLSLKIMTARGIIDFCSFFRRDKAYEYIIKLIVVPQPQAASDPLRESINMKRREDQQVNFSVLASLVTKQNKDSILEGSFDDYERLIEVSKKTSPKELAQKFQSFHRSYLHQRLQVARLQKIGNTLYCDYQILTERVFFLVYEKVTITLPPQQLDRVVIAVTLTCEIVKGRFKQRVRDSFKIQMICKDKRVQLLITNQKLNCLLTHFENKILKDIRLFYDRLLMEFQKTLPELPSADQQPEIISTPAPIQPKSIPVTYVLAVATALAAALLAILFL